MTRLDELLEQCLNQLGAGSHWASIVQQHPEQATDLGPLLESAQVASAAAVTEIPKALGTTVRARVLRHAAEMRASAAKGQNRVLSPIMRVAISLALVTVLVVTSTRLVSASSGALPGDQLYSVKRSWEDLQLFFVFQFEDHQILESRFTQERLDEAHELLTQGRSAPITFSGLVMHQQDGSWLVSGLRVSVTASTIMPTRIIGPSDPVMITGITRSDGSVIAYEVRLLDPGVALPPLQPSDNEVAETGGGQSPSAGQTGPVPSRTPPPIPANQQASYRFSGVVGAMQGAEWIINGQSVHLVDHAQVNGTVKLGAIVTFDGFYSPDGRFEVTSVDVNWTPQARPGSGQDSGQGGGSGGEGGSDDGGPDH